MQTNLYLSPILFNKVRKVYGVSTLLSELGGTMSVLLFVMRMIILPIAKHAYYINAIKRLFFVRTKDEKLM